MKNMQKRTRFCSDSNLSPNAVGTQKLYKCRKRGISSKKGKHVFRAGFTLIEVIVVLVIAGILAAAAVPSMIGFIERGNQISRTNTARTLYLAAQNQLTEKRVTKNLVNFVTNNRTDMSIYTYDDDTNTYTLNADDVLLGLPTNVSDALSDDFPAADAGNEPYVHYISKPTGYLPESQVHKLLDPVIQDKSILDEAILIEYNVKTGVVLSVFYGDAAGGSSSAFYKNTVDTAKSLGYGSALPEEERVDGARPYEHADDRKQGYYGVDQTFGLPEEIAKQIIIMVDDGANKPLVADSNSYSNVLYATILMPTHLLDDGQEYDLKIGGHTIENAFADTDNSLSWLLNNAEHIIYEMATTEEDYRALIWVLDYVGQDMTTDTYKSRSIGNKYPTGLTPDKNMTISLINNTGVEVAYSNEFNPYYVWDEDANYRNQLKIKSARHLYNIRYKSDGKFALINDIDMLPTNIADNVTGIEPNPPAFSGTLTGQGFAVSDLHVEGNGFFEEVTGRVEALTLINPTVAAPSTSTAGVLAGANSGSISDIVIISDGSDAPITGGASLGGVVGANESEGRISRTLYLARAPEKDTKIYPITSKNDGTIHNPSVIYLSGSEIRPLSGIVGNVYNPSTKAYTEPEAVGTAMSTEEIFTQVVGDDLPFSGYSLNTDTVTDSEQIDDAAAGKYPYPYLESSAIFEGYNWPIAGGDKVSLRYYEVYTDNTVGYYYYDPETNVLENTLKEIETDGIGTIVKDDGYIIVANADISLTFGSGTAQTYVPTDIYLGATPVKGAKISDSTITGSYTTPISVTGNGLPTGTSFNPLFAKQVFNTLPGIQGGTGKEIEIRSPRQLANIRNSAGIGSTTYRQTLNIDFSKYEGFDQFKPNPTTDEFEAAIVNANFSASSTYDGLGNRIIGVKVAATSPRSSVFSQNSGTIKNVNIYNSNISGTNDIGALVGYNQGTVSTVSAIDTRVAGTNNVGGLVGSNAGGGTISDAFCSYTSKANGAIDLSPQADSWVPGVVRTSGLNSGFGGMVGLNSGTIENVYVASYVGGDSDGVVKPVVGSGNGGSNIYYLYGNNFNSNENYSPKIGEPLKAYELSDLLDDSSFGTSGIWSSSADVGKYPYPEFANAEIPETWCAPTAPTYPLKYYEIYLDDDDDGTLEYGLWGGADDDTLQYDRTIITDGYLLYTGEDKITLADMKIFIGSSPDSETNLYGSTKPGYGIKNLFGTDDEVICLSTTALEDASLGLSPVYLKLGRVDDPTAYFEGWVNPLFGKAIFNAKPSGEYEHIIRTPRHLQNIGSTKNSGVSGYISALVGKFRQETNLVFTDLNSTDKKGYIKVDDPSKNFTGGNVTKLDFPQAGVEGTFSGSYNASYKNETKRIINFENTDDDQSSVGIFQKVGATGKIENLIIADSTLSGINNIGGVAGINEGKIKSVHVICSNPEEYRYTGTGENIGGIAGSNGGDSGNKGTIEMCAVENQSVEGPSSVGGIVGDNSGMVQDVYYIDARSSVDPLETMIISNSGSDAGGIVGTNSHMVTRALYLGIAPQTKNDITTTIYPIVGGGDDAEKSGESETCFYASGSAYSLTAGTNYEIGNYNYLSASVDAPVELSGGGFGYDTAFLELEFVAMMDASENTWGNWTYGVRAGSKPYPYAIVDGMTPPANWHEVSGSGKPAQLERDWEDGTEGSTRSKNLNLINPDFDLPLIVNGNNQNLFSTSNASSSGKPFWNYGNGFSAGNIFAYYPMSVVQGWNMRPINTSSTSTTKNAIQIMGMWHTTSDTAADSNGGRARTNYLGVVGTNNDNSAAGVCVELNPSEAGTLYQVCATVPGTELYYSFYHATRGDRTNATTPRVDSLNFFLSGTVSGDSTNVQYKNGMTNIRPCMTIRGNHDNRYTRRTVNYAYVNGVSGTGANVLGKATFYDPSLNNGKGGQRTAYLYDVWVGSQTGTDGYGITFWSDTLYSQTTNATPSESQIRQDGVLAIASGANNFGGNSDALHAAQNNIIGYWDAKMNRCCGTTDLISEWKQFYGKYTIPEGQDFTEFAYQWRSSTTGSGNAFGNMLDGISFEAPSYVTVSKAFDDVNTLYKNPGEPTKVTLTAKNWGEVPAKGIVITDTLYPFTEYVAMPTAIDSIVVKNANGSDKTTLSTAAVASAYAYDDKAMTITLPDDLTLATNEAVAITFTLMVREDLFTNNVFDTFGYYVKNQAEVFSRDAKYIGYEKTDIKAATTKRLSNIVQMFIDPIRLSKTAEEVKSIEEKDANGNPVQYYDIALGMESSFATEVSGLVNDAIPKGFKVVGDVVVEKSNPNDTVSAPRVVENGDGTTTVVVSNLKLNSGDKVAIKYRLMYIGEGFGTVYSNIEANYKYQYTVENQQVTKQMTGAVAFPKPTVAVKVKTKDDTYRVEANVTSGEFLDIGTNDYATDVYQLSQGEYDIADRNYVLLKDNGTVAGTNIDGQYVLSGTGYTATLIGDKILLTTTANMPNLITLKYKVALTAVSKGQGADIDISSRDTTVTIYKLANELVYYEKYENGDYGLYFVKNDPRNTLDDSLAIEESGYAVLSALGDQKVKLESGDESTTYVQLGDTYLYKIDAPAISDMTLQRVFFAPSTTTINTDSATHRIARLHPNFAKAVYASDATGAGNSFAIRTPEQMQNIGLIAGDTAGKEFMQERNLDFSAVSLDSSVVNGEFKGTYDGDGKSISNVFINAATIDYIGLFSKNAGTIKDIKLTASTNISGQDYVGGVAGINEGNITDCSVEGNTDGSGMHIEGSGENVGGIAGSNKGTITNCTVRNATSTIKGKDYVGGIAGVNGEEATITGVRILNVRIEANGANIGVLVGANLNETPNSVSSTTESNVNLESPKLPLKKAIIEAEEKLAGIVDDNAIGHYTAGTVVRYQAVIKDAQDVLGDEGALSENIQGAITALTKFKDKLPDDMIYGIALYLEGTGAVVTVTDGIVIGEDENELYTDRSVKGKQIEIDTRLVTLPKNKEFTITVLKGSEVVEVTESAENMYTFTMPEGSVTVTIGTIDAIQLGSSYTIGFSGTAAGADSGSTETDDGENEEDEGLNSALTALIPKPLPIDWILSLYIGKGAQE